MHFIASLDAGVLYFFHFPPADTQKSEYHNENYMVNSDEMKRGA
jgi:hypothetical protein